MARRWNISLLLLLFCAGYVYAFFPGAPVAEYYPAAHKWVLTGSSIDGPAMRWFGKMFIAAGLGLVGWIIGLVLDKTGVSSDNQAAALIDVLAWSSVFVAMAVATIYELVKWL